MIFALLLLLGWLAWLPSPPYRDWRKAPRPGALLYEWQSQANLMVMARAAGLWTLVLVNA